MAPPPWSSTRVNPLPVVPVFKIMTQGRKAWFFFDREMVALGAGISSTRDEPVGTTLNQTLLHGPVLIDGHEVEPGESKVRHRRGCCTTRSAMRSWDRPPPASK